MDLRVPCSRAPLLPHISLKSSFKPKSFSIFIFAADQTCQLHLQLTLLSPRCSAQMQVLAQQENPAADLTPLSMYNKFVERVRRHLHVVLTFSPIGDAFRARLRMFPSLINCCTIDWFQVRGVAGIESWGSSCGDTVRISRKTHAQFSI